MEFMDELWNGFLPEVSPPLEAAQCDIMVPITPRQENVGRISEDFSSPFTPDG